MTIDQRVGESANFRDKDGTLFLVRCYSGKTGYDGPKCDPKHGRVNWAPAVATGRCAWCGWEEKDEGD